jgi:peptidoglycan/xylan/chitin deacetylase (PgdA/CDA1 family)
VKIKVFKIPRLTQSIYRKRIWHSSSEDKVFITFDDGPHEKITPWLLALAKKESVKLNFFWLGVNVQNQHALLSKAEDEGHFIANHGYQHLHYAMVSSTEYLENFLKAKDMFPNNAFRPPYGRLSPSLAQKIYPHSPIIMWSWLSYDWEKNVSNEKILESIEKKVKAGDILVFHESDKTIERIFELIPAVIAILKKKQLTLSTLDGVIKEHQKHERR